MKKVLIGVAAVALFACKENKTEVVTTQTTDTTTVQKQATEETVVTEEQPTAALSTKTLNNVVISVVKANVTGKILYVEAVVKSSDESSLHVLNVSEINYVDDAQAKKHEILKDDEGIYQASPMQTAKGSRLQVMTNSSKPEALISLKFAAPPAESKTITLNLPEFGSFEAIPVSR